ncbi:MAG TPA: hypothetical protein VF155_01310 [Candidatus Dormibacteraeota bacterium]
MGDLVSFPHDIETLGDDFRRASGQLHWAFAHLHEATDDVRRAFHNHPDRADAAVAPFTKLRAPLEQIQRLLKTLGDSLTDVGTSYRDNDITVAKGWERVPMELDMPGRR